jgi:hypothetical protein
LNINVGEGAYTGYQYQMQFPATGFTLTGETTTYSGWQNASLTVGNLVSGATNASAYSSALKNIPTGDIEIGTVEFTVGTGVATGEYDVTISNFNFLDGTNYYPVADVTFKVKVVSVHTVELDELATTAPAAATGVNVKVKRTLNANKWSTICLPFAMTAEQVTSAFGAGTEIKDFTSWSSKEDDETGDIVSITIGFTPVTTMAANHPYLIKVANAITYEDGFTIENVNIAPEATPNKQIGKGKKRGTFYGNYVANSEVPENDLFVSNNKFYYSNGSTKMKAFRGYFDLYDYLSILDEGDARISMVDDDVTGINTVHGANGNADGTYDLQGRKVENPKKGLYINNGKKVVIK